MKRWRLLLGLAALLTYLIMGCADIGKQASTPGGLDTTQVSYAGDVQPIFTANCMTIGICHGASVDPHFLDLTNYAGLMDSIGPHAPVIIPFEPDSSFLAKRIEGIVPPQMPLGGTPLSQNQIDSIRQWIAEGALDN